ncbi:amino acid permease-domain-containing protein [Gamsiella multidivaricata]|uniref:amino acid permease-domain-containing protein n=1 Tax=Gamsiella multidivaricata TaxID=101098 RepID=UPI0022209BB9|nr:amino acid permease-domain-containing protein [Gamsiella multidivaricata]KAI7819776.1 amino acid permease-domain-containing protein [Gamsiella multidivaricata]
MAIGCCYCYGPFQTTAPRSDFDNAELTVLYTVLLCLGGVIGTGVFVLMGSAAATQAGPSVTLSLLLGGFVSGIAALSYAEMASMIPIAGSAYTYAYASIGELAAWIIGWDLVLEYLVGAATVSVGWSSYMIAFLKDAFNWDISPKWTNTPIAWDEGTFTMTGDYFNTPAFVISAVVSTTIYFGIHMTARINNYLVVFKVIALVIVIFSMIPFVKPENYHPYLPPEFGGVSGMLSGASTVFFAYIGFDSISTTAQEAKEPQVNLPVGIMSTIVISTVLYVGVSVVTVGVAHYTTLGGSSPVVDAVRLTKMHWLVVLTELGALAATTSVILVLLIAQPRVFYSMANDGLIPRVFARVHPKYKTPYMSTLISGIICSLCGGLLPMQVLSDISSVGTIFAYFVVNIGVIILRYTRKTVPRRFKVPGGPFLLPGIGAASALLLLKSARRDAIYRLLGWMAIGLFIYVFYGRNHSEVNNPRLIVDEPMRVLHENFSADNLSNYQGYTDDDLRQQYARQLARRMDYNRPRRQRYSDCADIHYPPSDHGDTAPEQTNPDREHPSAANGPSPFEDDSASSYEGIDSGHGLGATIDINDYQKHGENVSISVISDHGSVNGSVLRDQSAGGSPPSFRYLQAGHAPYPKAAHISSRIS